MNRVTKRLLVVGAAIAALLLVRCSLLGQSSHSGRAPGLESGLLAPCPEKPNCVCSEFADDAEHHVPPLAFAGIPAEQAWTDLQDAIEALGGEIFVAESRYLAATFTSAVFRFVDDVECRLDASEQKIQIRSASRVGHSDLGVNRRRVEAIAREFERRSGAGAVE